jgi:hypothetical protein
MATLLRALTAENFAALYSTDNFHESVPGLFNSQLFRIECEGSRSNMMRQFRNGQDYPIRLSFS